MRCPTLSELPPPPPGKTGWPWTEESPQLPDTMPDGHPWPRVSIVTPSYNQGQFIEETIRSVLLQGYPNLEYIIIDGGSADDSVEIIRKYEPWLAYWVSEPDRGQSHAINKGFKKATGEVFAYLNSDDVYEPNAIAKAVTTLSQNPDAAFVYSDSVLVDAEGRCLSSYPTHQIDFTQLLLGNIIPQPTVFCSSTVLGARMQVREDLHFVMDYELWLRVLRRYRCVYSPSTFARFRMHSDSKSGSQKSEMEEESVCVLEEQYCLDPDNRVMQRALAQAHLSAGLAQLKSGNYAKPPEHFQRLEQLGYFREPLIVFTAKQILGFLKSQMADQDLNVSIGGLKAVAHQGSGFPEQIWNTIYAVNEFEYADVCLKTQSWSLLRKHVLSALRLRPAFLRDPAFLPFLIGALLGQRWLSFFIEMKAQFRKLPGLKGYFELMGNQQ
jgi:glycosyltransferase involved in cell wall biosynthesis